MTVKHGRDAFVLRGAPVVFVPEATLERPEPGPPVPASEQLSLF